MDELLIEALSKYSFINPKCEYLRHNENMTFLVESDNGKYILRIHKPIDGYNIFYMPDDRIESSIDLLLYLRNHSKLLLQEPIKNIDGEFITILSNGIKASVLSYIEGKQLTKKEFNACIPKLAELSALLHKGFKGYKGKLLKYDEALIKKLKLEVEIAKDNSHLTVDEYTVFIRMLNLISTTISRLKNTSMTVIHSDLSIDNIINHNGILVPIDFSLCGYGVYQQDLGILVSSISTNERLMNEAIKAFKDNKELVTKRELDIFTAFSILLYFCSQHNRYYNESWFIDAKKLWINDLFLPLLEKKV